MPGRKPLRPLSDVADAAVRVWIDKGYRAGGISDVADALGLSHGAPYTYVASKQALLYLALLRTIRPEAVKELATPVKEPPVAEVVALLQSWVDSLPGVSGDDPDARPGLGDLIDALYGFIEANQAALQLIAQCAADLPDVARWYFVQVRRGTMERLGDFLRERIESGELRPVPDVPTAARFINETIAWFAMHRHGDPDSAMLSDDECRRTCRYLLLAAFEAPSPAGSANGSAAPSPEGAQSMSSPSTSGSTSPASIPT